MRREASSYLWDAHHAATLLREFRQGKEFADYEAEPMLRSAVERQFEIIGEALNQLSKVDKGVAAKIPPAAEIGGLPRHPHPRVRNRRRCSCPAAARGEVARARHGPPGTSRRVVTAFVRTR